MPSPFRLDLIDLSGLCTCDPIKNIEATVSDAVVSVQACTIQGVYDKIRFSAPKAKQWWYTHYLEDLITHLIENPVQMYHDPQDQDELDEFKLQRFIILNSVNIIQFPICYIEVDSRINLETTQSNNYEELIRTI